MCCGPAVASDKLQAVTFFSLDNTDPQNMWGRVYSKPLDASKTLNLRDKNKSG